MSATLKELQRRFAAAVLDGAPEPTIHGRVKIYRTSLALVPSSILRIQYPRLLAQLGPDAFDEIASRYLRAHPPERLPHREVGRALPGFLAAERSPHAKVAALGWAVCEARIAPAHEPFTLEAARAIDPERWGDLVLHVAPSLQIVDDMLVWRRGEQVVERAALDHELEALRALADATPFAALCEALSTVHGEAAPHVAFTLLQRWLGDGLLATSPRVSSGLALRR